MNVLCSIVLGGWGFGVDWPIWISEAYRVVADIYDYIIIGVEG